MRKHRKFTHILQRSHYFLSILVVFFFLCVELNSPVDPKFKGSYEFDISNLEDKDTVKLSIFQPYSIEIDTSVSKDTYYDFSCTVEKNNVAVDSQLVKNHFVLFFYKPCTTTVYVNGIRPNDIKDSKELTFFVENPYEIKGNDTVAHEDTASFSIALTDSVKNVPGQFQIRWSNGRETEELSKDSAFKVFIGDPSQDSLSVGAELFVGKSPGYKLTKEVVVSGWAPKIDSVNIKNYNSMDSSKTEVNQVDSFKVILTISDRDSSPYTVSIDADKSQHIGDIIVNKFRSNCSATFPPITNRLKDSLTITVKDNQNYSTVKRIGINITEVPPQVWIKDSMDVANNKKTVFRVDKSINCILFKWTLNGQKIKVTDSSTTESWEIGPFDNWTGICTLTVTPVSGTNKGGNPETCIINVKEFKYSTEIKDTVNTLSLKVNRQDTLFASAYKDTVKLPDSKVQYQWRINQETVNRYVMNEGSDTSFIVFKFTNDSIKEFSVVVYGVIEGENATEVTQLVTVSRYSPIFKIKKEIYDTTANSVVKFKYSIEYTDPAKAPVSKFYYKFKNIQGSTIKNYDTLQGIQFNETGLFTIEMWCVDIDGAVSNPDSISITISADLPYMSNVPQKISSSINQKVTIDSIVAYSGNSKSPIKHFLWDLNNDGEFETKTLTGSLTLPAYSQEKTDTITVKCVDDAGEESKTFKITIEIFSDIPKIVSFTRSESSTVYKGMPVKFNIAITDPDDDSLMLSILGNNLPLKTVKVAKNDTLSLNFKDSGSYVLKMAAKDDTGNISDEFTLNSIVNVDPGFPVINSIKIPNRLVYINDAVQCTVSAVDYNGKINKYQYYVNDSLYKENADSVLNFTFADSGMKKVSVKVIDNDTFPSEIKLVSFMVRRGQPVVNSFSVDSNSVYVNGSRLFSMVMSDTNGRIIRREIKWNDKIDSIIAVSYSPIDSKDFIKDTVRQTFYVKDTSLKAVHIRVMDEDSIYSEWKACSLSVKKGIPRIDSIKIEPSATLFIKDSIKLTVYVYDTNNTIQTVAVSWRNNEPFESMTKLTNGSFKIARYLLKSDTLFNKIQIRVTDTTDFRKDTLADLTVLPGFPVISDVSPDTVWALRDTTIRITAKDPDYRDRITKRSFDWNNDGIFEYTTTSDSGIHQWDTLQGNDFLSIFKVMVEDNDSMSTTKICTVFVKLGRPVLFGANFGDSIQWVRGAGAAKDTMFYKWKSGDTYVRINATDPNPNGQIVRYDWNRGDDGTIDYPNDLAYLFKYFVPNTAELLSVRVRDNDSLWSEKLVFYVFPDAAPQVPTLGNVTIQGDSVKLVWENSDLKDGDSTLFQIHCDTINPPVFVAKPYGTCRKVGTEFYYWYHPTASGRFRWKVTAKDARGSTSESVGTPYFDFVKP